MEQHDMPFTRSEDYRFMAMITVGALAWSALAFTAGYIVRGLLL